MITDETLQDLLDGRFQFSTFVHVQEMAQELLAYREAECAIWENAPEWANWFARDVGWFYQHKPQPGDSGEWENLAGVAEPAMHDGWETSLQERPK